jgi:hypothetical protein
MKIIALKCYRTGYVGFIEEEDRYVLFNLSRNGTFKKLKAYLKEDYFNYDHFLSFITKFTHHSFFLKEPIDVQGLSVENLERRCMSISEV